MATRQGSIAVVMERRRGNLRINRRAALPTNEELELKQSEYSRAEQELERAQELKRVQELERAQKLERVQKANQYSKKTISTKSSVGGHENTCKLLNKKTYKKLLNDGDLIEFRSNQPSTIRYPRFPGHVNGKSYIDKDDGKSHSHWAVYLGSRTIAHVAGPNMPYCICVLREIQTTNQRMSILKAVYPSKDKIPESKDFDDVKPIVRTDDLFHVAEVQNAKPYSNNQMDTMYNAGTSDEIVNVAKHLVGKALPHDFITKDCKDFAAFCRYGENLHSLKETKQPKQLTNKITFMGILGVVIVFVALVLGKML